MKKFFSFLSFVLFLTTVHAQTFIAGSTYTFDFPTCIDLNVTMICDAPIFQNEFTFSPDCEVIEKDTYIWKWNCKCSDGYQLKMTINPASNNSCLIIQTYKYSVVLPEQIKEFHYSSSTHTVEKPENVTNVTYVNKTEFVIQKLNETEITERISNLTQRIEELSNQLNYSDEKYESLLETYSQLSDILSQLVYKNSMLREEANRYKTQMLIYQFGVGMLSIGVVICVIALMRRRH